MPSFRALRSNHVTITMEYDAIGSGKGKKRIKGELPPPVHYAGSDSPLSPQDYRNHPGLQMFPTMAG